MTRTLSTMSALTALLLCACGNDQHSARTTDPRTASAATEKPDRDSRDRAPAPTPPPTEEQLLDCLYTLDPQRPGYDPHRLLALMGCAARGKLHHPRELKNMHQLLNLEYAELASNDASAWARADAEAERIAASLRKSQMFCNAAAEKAFFDYRPARKRYESERFPGWYQSRSQANWLAVLGTCGPAHFAVPEPLRALLGRDGITFGRWFAAQRIVAWLAAGAARTDNAKLRAALSAALSALSIPLADERAHDLGDHAHSLYVVVEPERISVGAFPRMTVQKAGALAVDHGPGGPFPGTAVALPDLADKLAAWTATVSATARRPLGAEQEQALQTARADGLIRAPKGLYEVSPLDLGGLDGEGRGRRARPLVAPAADSAPRLVVGTRVSAARILEIASHLDQTGAHLLGDPDLTKAVFGARPPIGQPDLGLSRLPGRFDVYQGPGAAKDQAGFAHLRLDRDGVAYRDPTGKRHQLTPDDVGKRLQSDQVQTALLGADASVSAAELFQLLDRLPMGLQLLPSR